MKLLVTTGYNLSLLAWPAQSKDRMGHWLGWQLVPECIIFGNSHMMQISLIWDHNSVIYHVYLAILAICTWCRHSVSLLWSFAESGGIKYSTHVLLGSILRPYAYTFCDTTYTSVNTSENFSKYCISNSWTEIYTSCTACAQGAAWPVTMRDLIGHAEPRATEKGSWASRTCRAYCNWPKGARCYCTISTCNTYFQISWKQNIKAF